MKLATPGNAPLRNPSKDETGSVVAFPRAREQSSDNNLPLQLSSFIGRDREVAEIERQLTGRRLLTLCGPGGCGKTRLALAVARNLLERFEDGGVWWVELASLSDPELVPRAAASALGVREAPDRPLTEVLVEHLQYKKALLILDNCEHLVEGCAALADTLLRACPKLVILATSREPLRTAGEYSWPVPSLSLPDPERLPPAGELDRYEAVRLFLERAGSVDAGFELTKQNASAVARLCHRLDGIPLAIELAAARVRVLTVEQISEKLEDPLGLLTTGSRAAAARHRTLRTTLQWSYGLLSEQERELLNRLSVFAGGWALEAAEAVGAAGAGEAGLVLLDLLSNLVDKSLVVAEAEAEGALRYRMLEPVRQYGLERLEESGEAMQTRERHARYYLRLAEEAEPELRGPDQVAWVERLETEHDNFRAVLAWALDPENARPGERTELGLRLTAALWQFWESQRPLLDRRATTGLLSSLAVTAMDERDYERAAALAEENLALNRGLGNMQGTNVGLIILGTIASIQGDHERAAAAFEENLRLLHKLGDMESVVHRLLGLAGVAALRGQPARAARLWGASEALQEATGSFVDSSFIRSQYDYENLLAAARLQLGKEAFAAVWPEGRAMTLEQAVEYALGEVEEPAAAPPTTTPPVAPERPPSGEKPAETAGAKATTAGLRIFALGSARVEKGERSLASSPDWIHKPRELLFYLLSHPQGRSKEQIGLALWPDASPAQLRSSFHDTVYRLRRALGAKEWIVFGKGRYGLDRSLYCFFDVEAFEENLSKARRLQDEAPEQAIRHLQEAANFYKGDFLEDSADSEWAMVRQEELQRAYGEALLLLGGLLSARERHAEAAEAYRKAIAHDELLEEAHRGLMRCQAALGQRGQAIRHYEELVKLLDERLDTSPAPETDALYGSLRSGE